MATKGAIDYREFRLLVQMLNFINDEQYYANVLELVERAKMFESQIELEEDTTRDDWKDHNEDENETKSEIEDYARKRYPVIYDDRGTD